MQTQSKGTQKVKISVTIKHKSFITKHSTLKNVFRITKIITMEGINAYELVAGYELYKQNY